MRANHSLTVILPKVSLVGPLGETPNNLARADLAAHPAMATSSVLEHSAQSGFANTDVDAQLTQRRIEKIILVGFVANTCIEGTARFGMELGYHLTLIKDETAAFDREGMHAAHEVNDGPHRNCRAA